MFADHSHRLCTSFHLCLSNFEQQMFEQQQQKKHGKNFGGVQQSIQFMGIVVDVHCAPGEALRSSTWLVVRFGGITK